MSYETYNVGVIGYGFSAKIFHIPFIEALPSLKLYGIVQRHPKPDDDAAKDHPGIKSWRSYEELLADPAVDIVIITTLPESHFAMAKAALEAGKHVVVEKPFVPTSAEGYELATIVARTGKQLSVYQNRRFDADFLTLKHVVEQGKLGRINEFETHFDRHSPVSPQTWRQQGLPGVGQIYDLGTHLFDQVVSLFGMPRRITAFIGNSRSDPKGDPGDSFTALLHYDKLLVTAKAAVISPEQEQLRFWVRGEKGSFKKYHLDVQEDQLLAGKRPGDEAFGVDPEAHYATLTLDESGKLNKQVLPTLPPATYVAWYKQFVEAIEGKADVPTSAEVGAGVIKLVELAKESSQNWRTVDV